MTDGEKWDTLVKDWRAKFDAVLAFPLFENGMMQTDLLDEYERLREAEREARQRKDDFLAPFIAGVQKRR